MKKLIVLLTGLLTFCTLAFSQSIMTASEFFKSVSDYYETIKDYEANIDIAVGNSVMYGKASFKRPEMLRIDFTSPAEQVILFNGDKLTIYLPGYSAILEQVVDGVSAASATSAGLSLLRRYYTMSYETGQAAVPLDGNSEDMVVNLLFYRRTSTEAFSVIKISFEADTKLIRRVTATTPQNEVFTFNLTNYNLNTGLTDQRFIYDPPSSANDYNNFLFSE